MTATADLDIDGAWCVSTNVFVVSVLSPADGAGEGT